MSSKHAKRFEQLNLNIPVHIQDRWEKEIREWDALKVKKGKPSPYCEHGAGEWMGLHLVSVLCLRS